MHGMADLGTLGGNSVATAVNDRGTIAVGASTRTDNSQHAFAWTLVTGMVDLGALGVISSGSYATGVNDSANVVGFSWYKLSDDWFAEFVTRGFVWTPSDGMRDLGTFGGDTYPNAINNLGLVVGTSYTAGNATSRPFAWSRASGLIDLGSLGGPYGEALAVSDSGVVVGYSYTAGYPSYPHPFAWTEHTGMTDLGILGTGTSGSAQAVNDYGVVVGYTSTAGNSALRAFRWTAAGGISYLEPSDARESYATGVNNNGLVVGNHYVDGGAGLLGFAWTADQGTIDLNPVDALYSQISRVNGSGVVLGFSSGGSSAGRATVWKPRGNVQTSGLGFN
jgi:probable HAF family extracellular repeat protein